jgi:alkylated DNA repair dioxygenase AlkB
LLAQNPSRRKTGETYNSCLLNLYHTGTEGMGWHSDAEKNLKKNGAIASVSFGAERNLPSNTETARKRYHRTYPTAAC